jgi:nitrite reductase/ring-hydroxylating ferredoxin subunit
MSESDWVTVAAAGDLDDGEIRPIEVGGLEMILIRDGDAHYATQRRCLHQGADLAEGIIAAGELICPLHAWRYRADTGVHVQSRQNCLVVYRVRVAGDAIQIDPRPIRNAEEPT